MADAQHEPRDLLAEVALGIADGADRARVLEHVGGCADCRLELERQSAIADGLLQLAPEQEPPPGFELGVLRAIESPAASPRSFRGLFRRSLPALAAATAAAAIAVGGLLFAFGDDRRLADEYRSALDEANGSYFGAVRLADAAGRPGGVLFRYRGDPSWILVTVDPRYRGAIDEAELIARDGRRIPLRSFRLADGAWGGSLPVPLDDVAAVHLVDANGRPLLMTRSS
jgi:putative zinc finger protein